MQRERKPTHLGVPGRAMILAVSLSAITAAGLSFEMWASGRTVVGQPLISRINPNTADASLLMTLPNIGPARAAAIVEYRERQGSGVVVFRRLEDLQAVKGIGPRISEGLRPWLDFETRIATAEE
jgi:competence protein ComEA